MKVHSEYLQCSTLQGSNVGLRNFYYIRVSCFPTLLIIKCNSLYHVDIQVYLILQHQIISKTLFTSILPMFNICESSLRCTKQVSRFSTLSYTLQIK